MVLDRLPAARIFGVDSSSAMLALAGERLQPYGDRVRLAEGDLTAVERIEAPDGCAAVIAVQSLHHLAQPEYAAAAAWTFSRLEPNGWFVIIDRLAIPSPALYDPYHELRDHQGQSPNPPNWAGYLEWLDANGDRPQSAQVILGTLEEAGFVAAALDVRGDRGMLIARR